MSETTELTDRSERQNGRTSRRKALAILAVRLAAVAGGEVVVLRSLGRAAQSSSTSDATEALQLLLRLEYLEAEFFRRGLTAFASGAQGFAPGQLAVVQQIAKHEGPHIALLRSLLGSTAPPQPDPDTVFDFTAGGTASPDAGPFAAVFSQRAEFFKLAQLLKDASVRAYKGQLVNFGTDRDMLQAALQIHSTEARHAAAIRLLRGNIGATSTTLPANLAPWPTNAAFDAGYTGSSAAPNTQAALAAAVYGPGSGATGGEDNLTQLDVTLSGVNNTEAFDEPLPTAAVTGFLERFRA